MSEKLNSKLGTYVQHKIDAFTQWTYFNTFEVQDQNVQSMSLI